MSYNVSQETLDLIKVSLNNPKAVDEIMKAFTTATGLVYYDLQGPAKKLYPVLTPFRNKMPRVRGAGGTATHWKAITGVNISRVSAGVAEGQRGGMIATALADYMAAYKTIGLEDSVTRQADLAAMNFDDAKAVAVEGLLAALMIAEEGIIYAGNAGLALGTTPTPTVVAADTGGALTGAVNTGTVYNVYCVALTPEGYGSTSVAGGVPGSIVRTNTDNSQATYGGGNAKMSLAGSGTISAGITAGKLTGSVAPVPGAAGYAWFWGTAGNEVMGAVTTLNSVVITAAAAGTQKPGTAGVADADYSKNGLIFDGLQTLALMPGSGAYVAAQPTGVAGKGTPLTSDGAGGIVEFNNAFSYAWNNYRLSYDEIWLSGADLLAANSLIIKNGGAPLIRYNLDANNPGTFDAGVVVGSILNPLTNKKVQILIHPNAVQGTIFLYANTIPYKLSNVTNLAQILYLMDYWQTEWPYTRHAYEYGIYAHQLLQHYFPPAMGVIYNVGLPS